MSVSENFEEKLTPQERFEQAFIEARSVVTGEYDSAAFSTAIGDLHQRINELGLDRSKRSYVRLAALAGVALQRAEMEEREGDAYCFAFICRTILNRAKLCDQKPEHLILEPLAYISLN